MLNKLNLKNKYSPIPFILSIIAFALVTGLLIYNLSAGIGQSDIPSHIDIALGKIDMRAYSLFHFLMQIGTSIAYRPKAISTIMLVGCVIAPIIIFRFLIFSSPNDNYERKYLVDFFSFSMGIVSMIVTFLPVTTGYWYLGQGTPNPWHSPTFILCKPFSLLVFFLFVKIYNNYLTDVKNNPFLYIAFSICSVLSMSAKPSFLSGFMPACCLYLFFELIRTKGKSFYTSALLGIFYLPSLLVLLQQNQLLFTLEGTNSIHIGLGVGWKYYSQNIPFSILLSIAFPLFVFLCNLKRLDFSHKLGFLALLFGTAEYYFLYESGPREGHANFAWSFYFGVFIAFVVAIDLLLKKDHSKIQNFIAFSLFQFHLFSGFLYIQRYFFLGQFI